MTVCLAKLKLYIYNFIFHIVRGKAEIHVAVVEFHRQLIFFCVIYVLVTISKHENKRELKSNQGNKVKTSLQSPLNKREGLEPKCVPKLFLGSYWGRASQLNSFPVLCGLNVNLLLILGL